MRLDELKNYTPHEITVYSADGSQVLARLPPAGKAPRAKQAPQERLGVVDGFKPYSDAIEDAFGVDCAYGQLVKQYEGDELNAKRNGHYKGATRVRIQGEITDKDINTSFVERSNLDTRQQVRRFTRKTNGFSKKLRNHTAAVALHVAHHNLCWVVSTLRVTPAMQLGIADHVWTIAELVTAALAEPKPAPSAPKLASVPNPVQLTLPGLPNLRLVKGGR